MGTTASQITSLTSVYSSIYSDADQRKTSKLSVTGLCAGNSPGTGEFPAQMASNAKMFPFDDVIIMRQFKLALGLFWSYIFLRCVAYQPIYKYIYTYIYSNVPLFLSVSLAPCNTPYTGYELSHQSNDMIEQAIVKQLPLTDYDKQYK